MCKDESEKVLMHGGEEWTCSFCTKSGVCFYHMMPNLLNILCGNIHTGLSQAHWHMPIIPAFRRLRQEDLFEASLGYILSLVSRKPKGRGLFLEAQAVMEVLQDSPAGCTFLEVAT